jgi:hypothetical protein
MVAKKATVWGHKFEKICDVNRCAGCSAAVRAKTHVIAHPVDAYRKETAKNGVYRGVNASSWLDFIVAIKTILSYNAQRSP